MEAAILALSETLTGFLGVDATGAIDGDDDGIDWLDSGHELLPRRSRGAALWQALSSQA